MFIKFKAKRANISGEKGRRVAMFWEKSRTRVFVVEKK
jgi:hypothetical protein